jgi:hypothetical protein
MLVCFCVYFNSEGQSNASVATEVKRIYSVFEKHGIPYLRSFSESLLSPEERNTKQGKRLEAAYFVYYQASMQGLENTCLHHILNPSATDSLLVDRNLKKPIEACLYREFRKTFPGLTYEFYEKVRVDLKSL